MLVKGIGIYLASAGRLAAGPADDVVVVDDVAAHRYARLLVSNGRLAGTVLLGMAREAPGIIAAVRAQRPVSDLASLRVGDWSQLGETSES